MQTAKTLDKSRMDIHLEAMADAKDLKSRYLELFNTLIEVESQKIYYDFDVPSFYVYCIELLDLPRQVAMDFQVVVRKSLEVPELASTIRAERVTISKARKICSVVNESNHSEWIALAANCSCREIEKTVALANPREAVTESLKFVAADTLELKMAVGEEWSTLLARTKDLLAQKHRRHVSTEEALHILMNEYCEKNDPVVKAQRASTRNKDTSASASLSFQTCSSRAGTDDRQPSSPKPIRTRYRSAAVEHSINARDKGQCCFVDRNGKRCAAKRWTEKHHIKHFGNGGDHSPANIETLCWGHHKIRHLNEKASVT